MFEILEDNYYYLTCRDNKFSLTEENKELVTCDIDDCDGVFKIALYCILVNDVVNEVMMSGDEDWDEYEYLIVKAMEYIIDND